MKIILLAEDDPRDVELTLTALAENHLANTVVVVHDGEEALSQGKIRHVRPREPHFYIARCQDAESERA
jgi:hypothetical protein